MLGLCWWCVSESDECLRYIIEHGDMDNFVDVACAASVLGAFVVFFQDAGVFTANVFDAKVVNTECEGYRSKIVLP
jgi:hypothetical protein